MSSEHDLFESPRSVVWLRSLLLAIALLSLLPANHLIPLIDRDEPRFARATEEMMLRNEWIVPYFNNQYRFDKPILIYWLMRACYGIFGVNEFAARLPSVIFAALYGVVIFEWARRWFSLRAAFWAAGGLLTCFQLLIHGRSAVADMPMVVFVALSLWAAYELLHGQAEQASPERRFWFWTLYVSLGLGFLAKGPVAWGVPALTWITYRWVCWRQPLSWHRLRLAAGLPITFLIVAAWGIPALVKTRGAFWTVGMHSHVWERGWQTFQGHGAPIIYYLAVAVFSFFPWSAHFPEAIAAGRRVWNSRTAYLVAWLLSTYALFSIYRTKLPHYVMPAYPAFFMLMGLGLDRYPTPSRLVLFWRHVVWGAFLLVGLLALLGSVAIALPAAFSGVKVLLAGAAILIGAQVIIGTLWLRPNIHRLLMPLAGTVVGLTLIGIGLRSLSPAVQLIPLFRRAPEQAAFGFCGFKEPSLVFYSHRYWESLEPDDVPRFLAQPGPRVLVYQKKEFRLRDLLRRLSTKPIGSERSEQSIELPVPAGYECQTIHGLNVARGSMVFLEVWHRLSEPTSTPPKA